MSVLFNGHHHGHLGLHFPGTLQGAVQTVPHNCSCLQSPQWAFTPKLSPLV